MTSEKKWKKEESAGFQGQTSQWNMAIGIEFKDCCQTMNKQFQF